MKVVSQQSLDVTNLESISTRILTLIDNQFEGNEQDRTCKLYEFHDQTKNDVISALKASSEDSQNQIITSINAHFQLLMQKDEEKTASLNKQLKELEEKYNEAKNDLEKHIALIKELEGKIFTIEEDKNLLAQKLAKSEADLALPQK